MKQIPKFPKKVWIPALVMLILGGLYGGSIGIIQGMIQNSMNSPGNIEIEKQDLEFISIQNNSFQINLSLQFSEPPISQPIRFRIDSLDFYYNSTYCATISFQPVDYRINSIYFSTILTIDLSTSEIYSWILQDLMDNNTFFIKLQGKLHFLGILSIYPDFTIHKTISISDFISNQNEQYFNLSFLDFKIFANNNTYQSKINLEITNPLDFPFNITYLKGEIKFDDLDGAFLASPKNNIKIADILLDWNSAPFQIPENSTENKIAIVSDDLSSLDVFNRILDEITKNQLSLKILNAEIHIEISGFEWLIPFNLQNIPVEF
ncbi:MAG: hypothetical protein ACTSVU_07425 [Promethearchaeota archaeon]